MGCLGGIGVRELEWEQREADREGEGGKLENTNEKKKIDDV